MKKSRWKVAAVAVLLLFVAGVFWFGKASQVEVITISERELVERLVVTGTAEPGERSELSAERPGRVLAVAVREGDYFQKGEVLVELDAREARASLQQAEATLEQARARLRSVTGHRAPAAIQDLEEATLVYEGARQELERTRELVTAGLQTESMLDQRRREFDRAQVALERARIQMEESSPRGSAAAEAMAGIGQAIAGRELAAARLANHEVRAPFDGQVLRRHVERGQTVQPGTFLLGVTASGPLEVRVDPDEREVAHLSPGLPALIVADAFPDHPMKAELDRINPAADRERATVTAFLRLLEEPPQGLRADMTLSVDIELRRQERATVLPVGALRGRASGEPHVLVAHKGEAQRRAVTIGLIGDDYVEIVEGLSFSDEVILTADVKEGEEVRR